jgi:hypothetical protein
VLALDAPGDTARRVEDGLGAALEIAGALAPAIEVRRRRRLSASRRSGEGQAGRPPRLTNTARFELRTT